MFLATYYCIRIYEYSPLFYFHQTSVLQKYHLEYLFLDFFFF